MFCSKCGTALPDDATICSACNAPVGAATATAPSTPTAATAATAGAAAAAINVVKGSGLQAVSALKTIAKNPVGSLPDAYATLGEAGALRVGVVFGVLSVICFLLGGYFMLPDFIRHDFFDLLGFGGVVKLIIFAFCPFVGLTLCSLGARMAVGHGGGLGGDCFIVGTALLPMSIWALIAPMFGYENYSVVGGLMVIALCIGVLILFSGYVKISKIEERWATYAVPLAIIITMWLSSVLAKSLMSPGGGGRSSRYRDTSEMPDFREFGFPR